MEETKQKSDDKRDIELEEREKALNYENKTCEGDRAPATLQLENQPKINKSDIKEGREVQPKKIPIGGIQMPGFFTRSKSKEKCKEEEGDSQHGGLTENAELLDSENKENESKTTPLPARIKLPNPFRKSKAISDEEGEKIAEPKEKKRLLDAIRLPLVSVFSSRKKKEDQNLGTQTAVAGLASMETLDENDKSADNKKEDDLKNVCLDINIDEKREIEKQNSEEEPTWKQKLKAYRIVISK